MTRALGLAILLAYLAAAAPAPGAGAAQFDGLLAPARACPGQTSPNAAAAVQERTMRCMTNFARRASGLAALGSLQTLAKAARRKSADILRCDQFSHEACGRDFTYWMEHFGYLGQGGCFRVGENIAWGSGTLADVRSIFRSWLHSTGHRENILGSFGEIGIGLRVGRLEGTAGAHVWTQEFGSREC